MSARAMEYRRIIEDLAATAALLEPGEREVLVALLNRVETKILADLADVLPTDPDSNVNI